MTTRRERAVAWAILGGLLLAGAAAVAIRAERSARPGPPLVENVTVRVGLANLPTGVTSTVLVEAVGASGSSTPAWANTLDGWLVRSDLAYASHVEVDVGRPTTTALVPLVPTEPGSYRLALISRNGDRVAAGGTALQVRGASRDVPPGEQSAARAGYVVSAASAPEGALVAGVPVVFTYSVTRTDALIPLQAYRGARGSLIAFREGGGTFVAGDPLAADLVPSPSAATFTVTFPEPGSYRMFFEFQASGQRFLEARWVEVEAGD